MRMLAGAVVMLAAAVALAGGAIAIELGPSNGPPAGAIPMVAGFVAGLLGFIIVLAEAIRPRPKRNSLTRNDNRPGGEV